MKNLYFILKFSFYYTIANYQFLLNFLISNYKKYSNIIHFNFYAKFNCLIVYFDCKASYRAYFTLQKKKK